MHRQNCKVLLFIDKFSGHTVPYQPTNVQVEFFELNMTSFVQPLDAGIIRDEAGEADIWKINILQAMFIVKQAWCNVTMETVKYCWNHTKIFNHCSPSTSLSSKGWSILCNFAMTGMTLPEAEDSLQNLYGDSYVDSAWRCEGS
ncbi:hypothetical protein C8J56DRAFT_1055686 [Mycena floridula]|nr:hypothetical protein C8J56DRAFT_1055686 [Mycena floridula]